MGLSTDIWLTPFLHVKVYHGSGSVDSPRPPGSVCSGRRPWGKSLKNNLGSLNRSSAYLGKVTGGRVGYDYWHYHLINALKSNVFLMCPFSILCTVLTCQWATQPNFTGTSTALTNQVFLEQWSLFSSMLFFSCSPSPSSSFSSSGETQTHKQPDCTVWVTTQQLYKHVSRAQINLISL